MQETWAAQKAENAAKGTILVGCAYRMKPDIVVGYESSGEGEQLFGSDTCWRGPRLR
jgi:hypothetical protein